MSEFHPVPPSCPLHLWHAQCIFLGSLSFAQIKTKIPILLASLEHISHLINNLSHLYCASQSTFPSILSSLPWFFISLHSKVLTSYAFSFPFTKQSNTFPNTKLIVNWLHMNTVDSNFPCFFHPSLLPPFPPPLPVMCLTLLASSDSLTQSFGRSAVPESHYL